jgi:hypothetical protein
MRIFFLKLLIFTLSYFLIDGGKTFIFIGTGFQYLTKFEHNSDIELLDHPHLGSLVDSEKWIKEDDNQVEFSDNTSSKNIFNLNLKSPDFINSIWQPPKSV